MYHAPSGPHHQSPGWSLWQVIQPPASLSLVTHRRKGTTNEQAFKSNTNLSSSFFSTGVSMMEYCGIGVMGTFGGKFFLRLAPSR